MVVVEHQDEGFFNPLEVVAEGRDERRSGRPLTRLEERGQRFAASRKHSLDSGDQILKKTTHMSVVFANRS